MAKRTGTYVPADAMRLPEAAEYLRTKLPTFPLNSKARTDPAAALNVVKSWKANGKLCAPWGTVLGVPYYRPLQLRRWVAQGGASDRRYGQR